MKKTLGYLLLTIVAIAVFGPVAVMFGVGGSCFIIGSSLLLALALIKGMDWVVGKSSQ